MEMKNFHTFIQILTKCSPHANHSFRGSGWMKFSALWHLQKPIFNCLSLEPNSILHTNGKYFCPLLRYLMFPKMQPPCKSRENYNSFCSEPTRNYSLHQKPTSLIAWLLIISQPPGQLIYPAHICSCAIDGDSVTRPTFDSFLIFSHIAMPKRL